MAYIRPRPRGFGLPARPSSLGLVAPPGQFAQRFADTCVKFPTCAPWEALAGGHSIRYEGRDTPPEER